MDFLKKWSQKQKIKKLGLLELEYQLLHFLGRRSGTMEDITNFLAKTNTAKNRLTLSEREFAQRVVDKLLKWDFLLCKDSRVYLAPKSSKIIKQLGPLRKARISIQLSQSSTCSSITFITLISLAALQLLFGIFTSSLALAATALFIATDFIAITATWWGVKHHSEKKATLRLLCMFTSGAILLIILGTKGILNPLPIKPSFPTMILSLISIFILLILARYQFKSGEKRTAFSFIYLSSTSKHLALAALATLVAERFSYAGIYLIDAVVCLSIGILLALSAIRIFTLLGFNKKETSGIPAALKNFLILFTALVILIVLILVTYKEMTPPPVRYTPNSLIIAGHGMLTNIGFFATKIQTTNWNVIIRIMLSCLACIVFALTILRIFKGIKEIKDNKIAAHKSLVGWFEYRCRLGREKFFLSWLLKLLSERTLSKTEILAFYKKQFVDKDTPFFEGMEINITRDKMFENKIDHYLGILLYDQKIAINKRDKFFRKLI